MRPRQVRGKAALARRAKKKTTTAPEAEITEGVPELQDGEAVDDTEAAVSDESVETVVAEGGDDAVDAEVAETPDAEEGTDPAQDEPVATAEDDTPQTEIQDDEPVEPMEPATAPAPVEEPKSRSSAGLLAAMLIGGAVSAALGFFAARYVDANEVVEGPTPNGNAAAIVEQQAALEDALAEIAELKQVDLEAPAKALVTPVDARVVQATERLDFMSEQLSALTERVETIAMRPTATGINADEFDDALAEFRDQLNAAISDAQTEISEAREEATRISEDAFSAEQSAMVRAAWAQVTAALDSGEPYIDSIATLQEIGGLDVPEAISDVAEDGVPTLAALQQSFPDVARDALAAVPSETTGNAGDRFMSFLRTQSGARSLAPREGDDPDAVLSRAEAALRNGDLAAVLVETQALPDPARAELADWESQAQARSDALEAAKTVSAELNSN